MNTTVLDALKSLTEAALDASDPNPLAVYDATAILGSQLSTSPIDEAQKKQIAQIAHLAEQAAMAIRAADVRQLEFRDLLGGAAE